MIRIPFPGLRTPAIHLCLLLALGFSWTAARDAAGEEEIAALRERVAELEKQAATVKKMSQNIASAKQEIAELKESLPEIEREIERMEYLRDIYRSAFRVQTEINRGKPLGDLVLEGGEKVRGAVFSGLGKGTVVVQSANGTREIPVARLPQSLGDKFNLPPPIEPVEDDYASLKASKPGLAKTQAEIQAEKKAAESEARKREQEEEKAEEERGKQEAADRMAEMEKARERNQKRLAKIQDLKSEYSDAYAQLKRAKEDKYAKEREFRKETVQTSQADRESELSVYNSRIRKLEDRCREIKDAIREVRTQLE